MNSWMRLAALLGACTAIALIVHEGVLPIFALLMQAGWMLLLLVPLHLLFLLFDVFGWRRLIPARPPVIALLKIATIREAIDRLLPVAGVGGEIVGVQLLSRLGVAYADAAASVVAETVMTIMAAAIFALCGALCLFELSGVVPQASAVAQGIAALVVTAASFFCVLMYGSLFARLARLANRWVGADSALSRWFAQAHRLDAAVRRALQDRRALGASLSWQLLALGVSCGETWFALRCLHHPLRMSAVVALEGLSYATGHIAFFVPAALGVQEVGLVAFGALLGLPGMAALALSLAKRMRVILLGVPALLLWQHAGIAAKTAAQNG